MPDMITSNPLSQKVTRTSSAGGRTERVSLVGGSARWARDHRAGDTADYPSTGKGQPPAGEDSQGHLCP